MLGELLLAQNPVTLSTYAGAAGFGSPIDGYFFSFDIEIPVVKGIGIAPTFTNCSNIKHREVFYNWIINEGIETSIEPNEKISGNILSTYELYILLHPLKLIYNSSKKSNKDFGLGIGYGIKSFEHHVFSFIDDEISGVQEEFGIRHNLSTKIYYNQHYKKYFIGIVLGIIDLSSDANSIIGFQFGANID